MVADGPVDGLRLPIKQTTPLALPTELWLQILEQADLHDAIHLWTTVRRVSRQFKDYVERLFISTYLPKFSITLPLPRRDPTTGTLRWPGEPIPSAQIVMAFDSVSSDHQNVLFRSPVALKEASEMKSVEELKHTSVLSRKRLQEAPPWVNFGRNTLTGLSMKVPANIEWNDEQKTWTWAVEWKKLITQFYKAKEKSNSKLQSHPSGKNRGKNRNVWR